jgi:hypothetical protein
MKHAAALVTILCALGAASAASAAPARSKAEACSLLSRLAQGSALYDAPVAATRSTNRSAARLSKSVFAVVCARSGAGEAAVEADGSQYFGQTKDGQPHGRGVRFYADGSRYVGSWTAGRRQGQGLVILPDAARYVGAWADDKPHGKGAAQYLQHIDVKVDESGKVTPLGQ